MHTKIFICYLLVQGSGRFCPQIKFWLARENARIFVLRTRKEDNALCYQWEWFSKATCLYVFPCVSVFFFLCFLAELENSFVLKHFFFFFLFPFIFSLTEKLSCIIDMLGLQLPIFLSFWISFLFVFALCNLVY